MAAETITSFDDLIGVLERNPQHRSRLRQSILDEEFQRLPEQVTALTEQVRALSESIASLADRMDQRMLSQEARTNRLMGAEAERRFRERAASYFGHLLRRLRVVDSSTLADLIDDAIDAGTFAVADAARRGGPGPGSRDAGTAVSGRGGFRRRTRGRHFSGCGARADTGQTDRRSRCSRGGRAFHRAAASFRRRRA